MKISLDWISDFVDLADIAPEKVADELTNSTAEVEGFERLERSVEGVLVAEVIALEPIAGGATPGKLQRAEIDCGARRFTTVCGAPNVRVGMKAAYAPPGVRLAGGQTIGVAEVGGIKSAGMLCSPAELGMSRWHEGLLVCPDALQPGTPLTREVTASDVIVEIDNKSLTHRPDLWGHYAFARELAAIFGRPLKPLPMVDLAWYDRLPAYPLEVEDFDLCPAYGCIEFRVAATAASPLVIQRRLHALGQRTFNLMVDLTNYVSWELAQPTHAFDADRIQKIRVAQMGRPASFTTLDGQERKLQADDLLIWNNQKPVALAGIMGGLESEVVEATKKVLLESANFKGSRIRRTSVRLDLRTDAAQRYEKSQPPVNVKLAAARILKLIDESGVGCEPTSRFTLAGDLKEGFRRLTLPAGKLERLAGAEMPRPRVVSILQSLGFQAEYAADGSLGVGVPPHRSERDISIPPDIVEEVLRIYGYGQITPRMPALPLKPLYVNRPLRLEHKARRLLAEAHGFAEVHTYGWTDERWLSAIGFEPERPLALKNPSTQQTRLLRTTLLPNLLALVPQNRAHRDHFRLFELGHVYELGDDGQSRERTSLGAVSHEGGGPAGLEEHFRAIKGAVEDLARFLGRGGFSFAPAAAGAAPWQAAGHWVEIRQSGRSVGGLGVLARKELEAIVPEGGHVVWLAIDFDELEGTVHPEVHYEAAPIYPGSWQDFSLLWDAAQGFAALEEHISGFAHPLIARREFLYAYKGKGLPPGQASYSYRYWIGAADHTLSSEEIEDFRQAFLGYLKTAGITLR